MVAWFKKHWTLIVTVFVTIGMLVFLFACDAKVRSITDNTRMVNRQELQLELDQIIGVAQIRMADLDKQEELRAIILQNALILVQGNPLNPIGIITAAAAIYGLASGGQNVTKVVKEKRDKRKADNGTT